MFSCGFCKISKNTFSYRKPPVAACVKNVIGLKGSLHTTIFSKYTGLLQLKNIFRIFWSYFWNILEINAFQNKNQNLCKKRSCFLKMADTDNNKLMGLLKIAGRSLLLSQVCTEERRKQRKWMRIWIRKRDSIGAYYSGSSHQRCSVKKGALRNFAKFTGKHLCQSLFFNKVDHKWSQFDG